MAGCIALGVVCCIIAGYMLSKKEPIRADITGIEDFTISVGDALPDLTEDIEQTKEVYDVMVDASEVNTDMPGKYPVTIYFVDSAGNQYSKSITCTVIGDIATEALQETDTEEQENG